MMTAKTQHDSEKNQSGKAEALKTYIEQTKLLVSLASGFILAPPAILSLFRRPDGKELGWIPWGRFLGAEALLIFSVLSGYVVLGTVAGSQHDGESDVYRVATRVWSIAQFLSYLLGIITFVWMVTAIL